MKILNFGSCNIDFVYNVDHIVLPGETVASDGLELFPGGKGLNQSIAAARAGADVYHAGCIGTDGQMLRDILCDNGVDVSFLKTLNAKTGHAIIQLDKKAENGIFLFGGSNKMITQSFVDDVINRFDCGDVLILQNEINEIAYIIDKAYEKGMSIVLNPAPFTPELTALPLHKISWLILNEIEACGLGGKSTPEENTACLRKLYPSVKIVLTLGKNGSICSDGEATVYQPSYKVDTVDTTAAGDTFIGYFIALLVSGASVKEALKTASVASALTVSKKGASSSIPLLGEVEAARSVLQANASSNEAAQRRMIDDYFGTHLQNASLGELAQTLGYSADYAGTVIKKLTGRTFSELLREKRCDMAAKLLRHTDSPIGDIIFQVGYENESFFRSVFKKMYGVLPAEYRKKTRGE